MKIHELIESYDKMVKISSDEIKPENGKLEKVKQAFIPNPQPQQDQAQLQQAYEQLGQMLSTMPPEMVEGIGPALGKIQQLPPQEQMQQITTLIQGLPQYQAEQQQPAAESPEGAQQAEPKETGNVNAENNLDNTKVTLSVRELLDLSSGGKATQSLLKVKQMADAHNKKMEAAQQQMEQAQVAQQQEQQQQSTMAQGGIYAQPMTVEQGQQ